jgi:hypothetical protein
MTIEQMLDFTRPCIRDGAASVKRFERPRRRKFKRFLLPDAEQRILPALPMVWAIAFDACRVGLWPAEAYLSNLLGMELR